MTRTLTLILIALWICLAVLIGVNIYRQYQVSRLQMRILKNYQLISQVDNVFKTAQDSLARDTAKIEQQVSSLVKPFPFPNSGLNWLLLKIAVIVLTVLTALNFWLYYRKHAQG